MKCSFFLVTFLLLILVSCNPKPIVDEEEAEDTKPLTMIENHEALLEGDVFFVDDFHLQGLERILHFFGDELTVDDISNIAEMKDFSTYSLTDLLDVMDEKQVYVVPTYGEADQVLASLKEGVPVLANFYPAGSRDVDGIFYGSSLEELIYFDLEAQDSRTLPISQLKQAVSGDNRLSLYVPIEDGRNIGVLRKDSQLYIRQAVMDAYYSFNEELFKELIPIIEENNWSQDYLYQYTFFYLFIEEDPKPVEPYIKSFASKRGDSFAAELVLKYYKLLGNEEEMKKVVQTIRIVQHLKEETLLEIERIATEQGDDELAQEARDMLEQKGE